MKEVRSTKKNAFILAALLSLCLCLSAGSAYAFFFAAPPQQTADAQTGIVQVQLNEDFPATDEGGASLDTVKTFSGKNTGDMRAYVRARIFPIPEYRFVGTDSTGSTVDEWHALAMPISDFVITTTSPDWVRADDGFLYYRRILRPGDSTGDVSVKLQVKDPSTLPTGIDLRLNLRVTLESAQTTHGEYKKIFNVPALPAEVEASAPGAKGVGA